MACPASFPRCYVKFLFIQHVLQVHPYIYICTMILFRSILSHHYVHMCGGGMHAMHTHRWIHRVNSHLPALHGFQGWQEWSQAWAVAPLLTEPSSLMCSSPCSVLVHTHTFYWWASRLLCILKWKPFLMHFICQCLLVCACMHTHPPPCVQCPLRPEKGTRSPRIRVTVGCKLHMVTGSQTQILFKSSQCS